ncbi:MAG: magnesium/cobalt transporter CorA, partial [Planctomycetales bacterium]|nr:magnesium/cobalt transporter CorA [Planctomycetales bacterium]
KRKRRRHRQVRPGTSPGTIVIDHESPHPRIDVTQFNREKVTRLCDLSPDQIPTPRSDANTWVNVVGLGNKEIIERVGQKFGIHPMAMEDVVNTHQRPKLDVYDDHLYLVLRMPHHNGDLDLEQVSIFLGKDFVLTWQERNGDCFDPIRERMENANGLIRSRGSDFFVYTLMDAIIDSYFPALIRYGDLLDEIEDTLTESASDFSLVKRLHSIRHDVRNLRRNAWSQRDVVGSLIVYQGALVSDDTRFHLRDVADHALRIVEMLESTRDSCSDLQDLYMSMVSLRMNEVMKVLTIIATIFIPLGFIAGLYGMNFSNEASPWNMPETQWQFGYPMALVLMAAVAIGMLAYFRHLRWIGK